MFGVEEVEGVAEGRLRIRIGACNAAAGNEATEDARILEEAITTSGIGALVFLQNKQGAI